MVTNVTSFGRSGLSDWVVQRVSAVILGLYTLFLVYWFLQHPQVEYDQWRELFNSTGMRIFSLLALLSLVAHAWIGVWTVTTDYLIPLSLGKSATAIRFLVQCAVVIALFTYLVWGIEILWGN